MFPGMDRIEKQLKGAKQMRILIGGGGTGGHIYPALALARHVQKHDSESEILFVGSARGLESKIVPSAGYKLLTIPASGFQRNLRGLGRTIRDLFSGIRQTNRIINDFKPNVILGTGGYVAAPLIISGVCKRYPVVLHEQNALPGLTNRIMAPFVRKVCISFAETASRMRCRRKIVFTGNPRAGEVINISRDQGAGKFGIKPGNRVMLIYGGSRGAQKLNEVVTEYLKQRLFPEKLTIIYVTGDIYYEDVKKTIGEMPGQVKLFSYLEDMPLALAVADLVLTRSGATTLAEITALGIPAILVPSPNVVNNHQYYNARLLSERAAAILIEEKEFDHLHLAEVVNEIIDNPEKLKKMAANSRDMGMPDAAVKMYSVLREVAS